LQAYGRVTPAYSALPYLRSDEGVACFNLQRAKEDGKVITAKAKHDWYAKVTADLEKLPDPAAGAEGETAAKYCWAKLQLAYLYLQEGAQYAKVEQIAHSLLEALPKYVTINEKERADLIQQAQATRYLGISGQISLAIKSG